MQIMDKGLLTICQKNCVIIKMRYMYYYTCDVLVHVNTMYLYMYEYSSEQLVSLLPSTIHGISCHSVLKILLPNNV